MNKYFIPAIILLMVQTASAQGTLDIKVRKPEAIRREFLYKGKPVSPLALIHLFSSQDGRAGSDTINLRKYPYTNAIRRDTVRYTQWEKDYQLQRSYYVEVRYDKNNDDYYVDTTQYEDAPDLVFYTVLGNTSGGKFIVLGYFKTGSNGRWIANVFTMDIKGDRLIRLGGFAKPMSPYSSIMPPVMISNDTITWDTVRYPIPASAR